MSCTNDCGCSPEIRDARTDEWVQIAPEPARPATLTPEQPVKAPGQGGDIFLTRGKPVEVVWPTGNRLLRYVDEGGYQLVAGWVGNVHPLPWGDGRIVRVLTTEDKPTQEPVLPRRIDPEDVRVGMIVERRNGDYYVGGRVATINDFHIVTDTDTPLWYASWSANSDWSLWLAEDAPEPVDPDAEEVGDGEPYPWGDARIVRVLNDAKPTSEPVLPRRIKPEDVRVGMVVERRKGEAAHRDRVHRIDGDLIVGTDGAWLWVPGNADGGWTLWLVEDAPEPVDPDAEAVERMAKEVHDRNCADVGCRDWDGHGESTRKAWREDARVVIRNLRAQCFDVTPRAEQ